MDNLETLIQLPLIKTKLDKLINIHRIIEVFERRNTSAASEHADHYINRIYSCCEDIVSMVSRNALNPYPLNIEDICLIFHIDIENNFNTELTIKNTINQNSIITMFLGGLGNVDLEVSINENFSQKRLILKKFILIKVITDLNELFKRQCLIFPVRIVLVSNNNIDYGIHFLHF
jgi:hypothetical protein